MKKAITTPVATVVGYNLDKPYQQAETIFEGTRITNGVLGLKVTFDKTTEEFKVFEKKLTSLGYSFLKVIKTLEDGTEVVLPAISSSTNWKPSIRNRFGEEIEAPTNVRVNYGDVLKVKLVGVVEEYKNKTKKGFKFKLCGVTILEHDTSKRTEPDSVKKMKQEIEEALEATFESKNDFLKED